MLSILIGSVLVSILLAAGLPNLELRPGEWGRITRQGDIQDRADADSPLEIFRNIAKSPGTLFLLAFIITLIYCVRSPQAIIRLGILLILIMILYLLKDYISLDKILFNNLDAPANLMEQVRNIPPSERVIPPPPWWAVLFSSLGISTLILGAAFILLRRLGKKPKPVEHVVKEIKKTLEEINHGMDIEEGVIRCYYEMCDALARHSGVKRQSSMTAREFEESLKEMGFRGDNIERLTRLFEKARYGARSLDDMEQRDAVDCLTNIVRECEGRG